MNDYSFLCALSQILLPSSMKHLLISQSAVNRATRFASADADVTEVSTGIVCFTDLITSPKDIINDFTCVFLFRPSATADVCKCVFCMAFFFFFLDLTLTRRTANGGRKIYITHFAFYTNDQITVVKLEIIDQLIGIYRFDGLLAWFFTLWKKKKLLFLCA